MYAEARAALARAHRLDRLTNNSLDSAVAVLDELNTNLIFVSGDHELTDAATHLGLNDANLR